MNETLKQAIEDAHYDRDCSGLPETTEEELVERLQEVERANTSGSSAYDGAFEMIDAQHDLINALLVFLEKSLND